MNSLLLTGGRIIDPASQLDIKGDLLLSDGQVVAVGPASEVQAPPQTERLAVDGMVVCPGLIDMHVHLRDPGQTAKESMATGTLAAAKGGFTSVVCMPNTTPVVDNATTVALIKERAQREAVVNVFVAGSISKGLVGEELAPIGALKRAGVVAITDDGHCVQNGELMRRAMDYAQMFNLPVLDHCQDNAMVTDGVMNEGYWSLVLGLHGWPAVGEDIIIARNILLAETTGAHVHCQHVSTAGGIRLIRDAKQRGLRVSGEACPHHFTLTDAALAGSEVFWQKDGAAYYRPPLAAEQYPCWPSYDTNFKMNPPLRSIADQAAIIEGIIDNTLDVIATDHAPHCDYEKEVEFDYAPFGITGLETAVPLALMRFVHSGRMDLSALIAKMTVVPARILQISKGTLAVGADADITILAPEKEWCFTHETTASKAYNSPFYGWPLRGKAIATIIKGKMVWRDDSFR